MNNSPKVMEKIRKNIIAKIPDDVLKQLEKTSNDVEFCKTLADNNIDVEQFEAELKKTGMAFPEPGTRLADEMMENVSGGWKDDPNDPFEVDVECPNPNCRSKERKDHSYQYFRSSWSGIEWIFGGDTAQFYRCKKCGQYFKIMDGVIYPND